MNGNPPNRFERRKQRTRRLLMQTAGELILEKGYDNVTIQDITERADVGRGTFYIHFEDKEHLVWEMLREHSEAVVMKTDAALEHESFPRREYLSWLMFFEMAAETRDFSNAVMNGKGSWFLYRQLVKYVTDLHESNLTEQRYSVDLELPPAIVAHFVTGALLHVVNWWLETPNDYTPEQMADMFYEMIYREPPLKKSPGGETTPVSESSNS
jgi:AcrR family transcriptional regulator